MRYNHLQTLDHAVDALDRFSRSLLKTCGLSITGPLYDSSALPLHTRSETVLSGYR